MTKRNKRNKVSPKRPTNGDNGGDGETHNEGDGGGLAYWIAMDAKNARINELEGQLAEERTRLNEAGMRIKNYCSIIECIEGQRDEAEEKSQYNAHLFQMLEVRRGVVAERDKRIAELEAENKRLCAELEASNAPITDTIKYPQLPAVWFGINHPITNQPISPTYTVTVTHVEGSPRADV